MKYVWDRVDGRWGEGIVIDVDALRKDMKNDSFGAFFGGGFGAAMVEAFDIDRASDEELVGMARKKNIDLRKYRIPNP